MNIVLSAFGHYEVTETRLSADCAIGHSFGTSVGHGSVNEMLADIALEHSKRLPIIGDSVFAEAYPGGPDMVDHVVEGQISDFRGQGLGSWGTLVGAKKYMDERGLKRPLLIAQAHHVGRVARQAEELGLIPVIPFDLPRRFDKESEQIWTRRLALWVPREIVGALVLRRRGEL